MAIKKVIRMGHPTLKKIAEVVPSSMFNSEELELLIQDLYDTMKSEGGIGIAAPQIDVSLQIALIDVPENSERYGKLLSSGLITIINPTIIYETDEMQEFYEGCLSVPGMRGIVSRPKKITVHFFDKYGIKKTVAAENFLATVFQHELDHLFGKLYIDRMANLSSLIFNEEYELFVKPNHLE
jgi:peptide deformylase